ncbi:MAG: type I restriction enzyme HsdR N-terminal domain-containing protein [Saprospiraceae bacterium]|nr:type I restriction enzyme HsdR N-terminal domain-containing protein [Saprospiraceae bacterium]
MTSKSKLSLLQFDLLGHQHELTISVAGGRKMVFDPLRKKKLVLQPEELVRQLLAIHLRKVMNYPSSGIAIEKGVFVQDQTRRFDMLIFDRKGAPWMLVECKSYSIEITERAVIQTAIYNQKLKAPYLLITNGSHHLCCLISGETITYLNQLPDYPSR